MLRLLLTTAAIAAFALPLGASATPILPQLNAKVTARSISVRHQDGTRVTTLRQGTYKFVVTDTTKAQNFHLVGPRVNLKTRVLRKASTAWTVYLSPGTYVFKSDRSTALRGTITVRSGPPPM